MNMTAVDLDEDINVDSDSRPSSPPCLQKPRINFSISALLGDSATSAKPASIFHNPEEVHFREDDVRSEDEQSDEQADGHDDRDSNIGGEEEEAYEELYEGIRRGTIHPSYIPGLGANFGSLASSLQASGVALGFNPTVLRVPAHRPPLGAYPPVGAPPPPPWRPHGIPLPHLDRATALAPHFPTLERLAG